MRQLAIQAVSATPAASGAADDAALMQRIAAGDRRAFDLLVRRHLPRVLRTARRILGAEDAADDVAQESFLRLWKSAVTFRPAAETGAQFSTWLYKIVLNLCIDHKRKRRHDSLSDVPEPPCVRDNAEAGLQRGEQSARVRDAVDALPPRQRAAFILSFYEECSNREMAEILGISVKAVESLLVRARRQLYKDLSAEILP